MCQRGSYQHPFDNIAGAGAKFAEARSRALWGLANIDHWPIAGRIVPKTLTIERTNNQNAVSARPWVRSRSSQTNPPPSTRALLMDGTSQKRLTAASDSIPANSANFARSNCPYWVVSNPVTLPTRYQLLTSPVPTRVATAT